jgi:hypothetical protein
MPSSASPGPTASARGSCAPSRRNASKGRVFATLEDLREAARAFIARSNAEWPIKKTGDLSPHDLRRQHELADMPMAA